VLIVGGGHAGISVAVEARRIGLTALVVDRMARVGDNWRLRYRGLKLHNKTPVNHLRYLPFPVTFPEYIPKDQIANWLESYVDILGVDFWTRTSFEGGSYDDAAGRWTVRLNREGTECLLHPKHIVIATSVSGFPSIPVIDGIGNFQGEVLHSSAFKAGRAWQGRSVVVFGTGTSAHDICQGWKPAAPRHHGAAQPDHGRQCRAADLRSHLSRRRPPIEARHHQFRRAAAGDEDGAQDRHGRSEALDAPLHARLEQAGFRLEFGEDGTGWPLKFRSRGGGYYFNVGCSELIADGKIRLIQFADIAAFMADGLKLKDGSALAADLFVLATGYKGLDHLLEKLFGREVAAGVGRVWGFDDTTQELRNMWTRTGQPGLWFTGGAFSRARIYSRYIALQIDAIERGCGEESSLSMILSENRCPLFGIMLP
jgi:putative flavoprotein involved in K+ transport